MMIERYTDGPLSGQASVDVLLDADTLRRLEHASKDIGYSIERLVQISAEEAALNYATENKLD